MMKFSRIISSFATSKMLKPPIPIPMKKPPSIPMKKPLQSIINGIPLSNAAQKLNISEQILRSQMKNPQSNTISEDELQFISIFNGIHMAKTQNFEMKKKSPVVTIMGHVDHGKTTLIDFLRKSNIAQKQHGGITQKIGAFHIDCKGQKITFIDTPGHQAFTNMRQRGATMTDLVVLIVAATEGVKKQTIEVIKIISQRRIPCIVAINKIDLPNADVESTERSLYEAGLSIEPMGGNIPVIHISAKTGKNVDLLSELILEQTKDIKAIFDGTVQGTILEARKNEKGFNSVTMVIQKGVLKPGTFLIMGSNYTKVKNFRDDKGNLLQQGIPGDAVQIIGVETIPKAGEVVFEVKDESKAKNILRQILIKKKEIQQTEQSNKKQSNKLAPKIKLSRKEKKAYCRGFHDKWFELYKQKQQKLLEQIERLKGAGESMKEILQQKQLELEGNRRWVEECMLSSKENPNILNLILKFNNRGIEQTILQQLESVAQKIKRNIDVTLNILSTQVGDIALSDINAATFSNAQIVGFGVQLLDTAVEMAANQKISPHVHELIHNFLANIEELALKKKKSSLKGTEKGFGQIAQVYTLKKGKKQTITVAGVKVLSGKLDKNSHFYIFRNNIPISKPIYADFIKVFKIEQKEVKKGQECVISLSHGQAGLFEQGDFIHCFQQ